MKRSRRELLAGAAGALGVLAAETVANATPASAAVSPDGDVVLGGSLTDNSTGLSTRISYTGNGQGVYVEGNDAANGILAHGLGAAGTGVVGHGLATGVAGNVSGTTGNGVEGIGGTNGVHGTTSNNNGQGVLGEHDGSGAGVRGTSATGDGVEGYGGGTNIGVYGQGGDGGGNGVQGYAGTAAGTGVFGVNVAGGTGVLGAGDVAGGIGVHGHGASIGVQAEAIGSSAVALDVLGKARFSRSGVLTVKATKSAATKGSVPLSSGSLVLATIQQSAPGFSVESAVPNVANSSIAIHLNQPAPTGGIKVAWFVVN
ncbi:MAG: hypothetical protein ACJ76P_02550 [Actinomycetota bacterium]